MGLILNIETSSDVCSVALAKDGKLLSFKETAEGKSHAALITVFISDVMKEASCSLSDLDAIAVSKGPGSYTGLRIGVSTAKGLCYSLDKPLIAINTLQSLAGFMASEILQDASSFALSSSMQTGRNLLLCPMLDARRQEVYAAIFNIKNEFVRETSADIVDHNTYLEYLKKNQLIFFGPGAGKCKSLINHSNAIFVDNVQPSARYMVRLAEQDFEKRNFVDTAYFEPFYLKEFVGSIPVKKNVI